MSSADTGPPDTPDTPDTTAPLPASPAEAAHVVKQEGRLGKAFLKAYEEHIDQLQGSPR